MGCIKLQAKLGREEGKTEIAVVKDGIFHRLGIEILHHVIQLDLIGAETGGNGAGQGKIFMEETAFPHTAGDAHDILIVHVVKKILLQLGDLVRIFLDGIAEDNGILIQLLTLNKIPFSI